LFEYPFPSPFSLSRAFIPAFFFSPAPFQRPFVSFFCHSPFNTPPPTSILLSLNTFPGAKRKSPPPSDYSPPPPRINRDFCLINRYSSGMFFRLPVVLLLPRSITPCVAVLSSFLELMRDDFRSLSSLLFPACRRSSLVVDLRSRAGSILPLV